jgi:hyperosmotically inducible periplasmic protein
LLGASLSSAATALLVASLLAACNPSPKLEVSDSDVTQNVKTALLRSDLLKQTDITVMTNKGDVRLTAVLDTQAQVDEALRIARASPGAHTIHDELTVKK